MGLIIRTFNRIPVGTTFRLEDLESSQLYMKIEEAIPKPPHPCSCGVNAVRLGGRDRVKGTLTRFNKGEGVYIVP